MNAKAVLNRLSKLGVTASAQYGNIAIRPASKVPPELKAEVRFNESELLAILAQSLSDGQPPPLDRPPRNEQELRRWMDHTTDPEVFARWLEWAMSYTDPVEGSPCPEDTPI